MGRKSREKAKQRERSSHSLSQPPEAVPRRSHALPTHTYQWTSLLLTGAALVLAIVTAWLMPRVSGDTFIALAGGRDVSQGKLGKPDDWSFATSGRVWMNQNWGFDTIAFRAVQATGETGLFALKALLILAIVATTVLAARRRGADWNWALLLTAAAVAGMRWGFELRANVVTYLMTVALLLILYWSLSVPWLIWLSVAVLAAWAASHGGFMLGFALLGLWTATRAVIVLRSRGMRTVLSETWMPAVALAGSVALAAALSPFGVENLTHPFTIVSSVEWQKIGEWAPVSLTALHVPSTIFELFALVAFILGAAAWRMFETKRSGGNAALRARVWSQPVAFDCGLVILMTAMVFSAVRFIPVALIALAPLAAAQASALFRAPRLAAVPAIVALALVVALGFLTNGVATYYSRENPRFGGENVFQKTVGIDRMPAAAADFLEDNDVAGRMVSEWSWEGFLRWRRPQLQTLLGGRAQQIYNLDNLHEYQRILVSKKPADELARWDIHLAVLPFSDTFLAFIQKLACVDGATWGVIFYDGRAAVLADLDSPRTRALAIGVAGGGTRFRNERVAAFSRSLCQSAPLLQPDRMQALTELVAATNSFPTAGGPWFVTFTANALRMRPQWLTGVLERQDGALAGDASRGITRIAQLEARLSIAEILTNVYKGGGRNTEARGWANNTADLSSQLKSILAGP